ncbi:hypothetical protein RUND412_006404 [Rhizina undulata]
MYAPDLRKENEALDTRYIFLKKPLEDLMKAENDAKNFQQGASEDKQKSKNVSHTKEKLRNTDFVKPSGIAAEKRILKGRPVVDIHHTKEIGAKHKSGILSTSSQRIKKPDRENGLRTNIDSIEFEQGEIKVSERYGEVRLVCMFRMRRGRNPWRGLKKFQKILRLLYHRMLDCFMGTQKPLSSTSAVSTLKSHPSSLHDVPKYIRGGTLEHIFLRENPSFRDLQDCVAIFQIASARQSFLLFAENRGGVSIGNALHPIFPLRWEEEVLEPKITDNFKLKTISNIQGAKDLQRDRIGRRVRVAGAEKIDVHCGKDMAITCDSVYRATITLVLGVTGGAYIVI